MKVWIKRAVIGLGLLLVLAVAGVVLGSLQGERKRQRQVDVAVQSVAWATDAEGLARGRYLFRSRGCAECHGVDGGGREFINDGKGMRISGPNITSGGPVAQYTALDWVRVIRHGVKADGQPVFIMPAEDYNRFTDTDVAALVGYVRALEPRTGGAAVVELPIFVKALYGLGAIRDAVEKIDHNLPPAKAVVEAVNAQHGAYVANMCIGCHGPGLSGGAIPGGPPDWPAAANITPGKASAMPRYPDTNAFVAMLRSGKRPDGSAS
jgi:mono/diheme cytochrome c family protein